MNLLKWLPWYEEHEVKKREDDTEEKIKAARVAVSRYKLVSQSYMRATHIVSSIRK